MNRSTRMTRRLLLALASLASLASTSALAAIPNYTFNGVTGVGDLAGELSSRLGTSVNATEHIINIADCELYSGGRADWRVRINPLPTGDWQYATAYAPPNRTCPTTDANPTSTDGSCYVPKAQRELDSIDIDFRVSFDELIGSECDSNTEGTAKLYVIVENPGFEVAFETIDVTVDLQAPTAPEVTSVTGGDGRFVVSWEDEGNASDDVTYVVYWDEVDFTEEALETVNARRDVSTTSVAIESSNIVNGLRYYVRVAAVDEADNESPLSATAEVVPQETEDFWERYRSAGGTDPGDFCFVATAAFGTPMSSELGALRAFRDRYLMGSAGGRALVAAYYQWGRFAAAWIADKPALRALARVLLTPFIWLAHLGLALGPLGALLALGLACVALVTLRRRWVGHILRHVPTEAR